MSEFSFTFARSGGPGGQNVNKVNSKAILRWCVSESDSLPTDVKERFLKKYANRMTADGDILLTSQEARDQSSNIGICLEKLKAMIEIVLRPPKLRRPTKPSAAVQQRRVEKKRELSQKKQQRRRQSDDD